MTETRSLYELNQDTHKLHAKVDELSELLDAQQELIFSLTKTIEGIQQLFIRAGEYRGKPRGRLPRR